MRAQRSVSGPWNGLVAGMLVLRRGSRRRGGPCRARTFSSREASLAAAAAAPGVVAAAVPDAHVEVPVPAEGEVARVVVAARETASRRSARPRSRGRATLPAGRREARHAVHRGQRGDGRGRPQSPPASAACRRGRRSGSTRMLGSTATPSRPRSEFEQTCPAGRVWLPRSAPAWSKTRKVPPCDVTSILPSGVKATSVGAPMAATRLSVKPAGTAAGDGTANAAMATPTGITRNGLPMCLLPAAPGAFKGQQRAAGSSIRRARDW